MEGNPVVSRHEAGAARALIRSGTSRKCFESGHPVEKALIMSPVKRSRGRRFKAKLCILNYL
jgi:hypothetical protein